MQLPLEKIFYKRKRYIVTFLTFCGFIILYILRTNLSIVIVDMTSSRNVTLENGTVLKKADFNWSTKEKGFIISAFFYGYLASPFGGILSVKYGGVVIYGLGIAITGFLTILSPFIIRINIWAYGATRVLEGIVESFSMAATPEIFVHWAPQNERSRMITCAYAGSMLGAAINYPLSGYIAYIFNWEAVFFFTGILSLIWFLVWILFIKNRPADDKFICEAEKIYLMSVTQISSIEKKNAPVPWKQIFTSGPVWAYLNENFCYSWPASFIVLCFPLYIKDVFDINIKNIGFISSLPLIFGAMGEILSACLADFFRSRNIISISNIHRIYIGTLQSLILLSLVIISFWANAMESIICFIFIRFCLSMLQVSYNILPIDMSPQYASILKGFGTTAFAAANLLNPTLIGFLVINHTRSEWNTYFLLLSLFSISSLTIFSNFSSGELQPWSIPSI